MAVLRKIRKNSNAKNPYGLSLLMQKLFMLNQKEFEAAEQLSQGMTGITEYMCQFSELFGFTAEYTDRDRQMDSTAYDGQRSSDVDIKDPWKDIAVVAVLPRRQHCRIWG